MALNINFAKNKGWNCPLPAPTWTSIGTVGTSGQMAAGHVLTSSSFPSAAIGSNLSWYNLANLTDASGNGRSFTSPNSNTYGSGILGASSSALSLASASSQYLSSSDAFFNPDDTDWTAGIWAAATVWTDSSNQHIFGNWESGNLSYVFRKSNTLANAIGIQTQDTSSNYYALDIPVNLVNGTWLHFAVVYTASTNSFKFFINGKSVNTLTMVAGLKAAGTSAFRIGTAQLGNYFNGQMDEFFFAKYAFTDNDIAKIYARKYSHNQNISPVSQAWIFKGQNGGQTRDLLDNIVDMQANDLYYDLSDEVSTTQVSLRLANIY